jgi:hypothetical protein
MSFSRTQIKTDKTDITLRLIVCWGLSETEGRRTREEMQYLIDACWENVLESGNFEGREEDGTITRR